MKIGSLELNHPDQYTQSYWAGCIVALADKYGIEYKFSVVEAMTHFYSLKELFGPVTWAILKTRRRFQDYIKAYELLAYQATWPESMIGSYQEFIVGYFMLYRRSKYRQQRSGERTRNLQLLQGILES